MTTWADLGIDESRLRPGENKIPCPKCGPTRKNPLDTSLSVNTVEQVFNCHNCQWAGSLRRRDHVQQGREYARKEWKRPNEEAYHKYVSALVPAVVEYFKRRGIPKSVLDDVEVGFGVAKAWSSSRDGGKTWQDRTDARGMPSMAIYFPYRMDGQLINVKSRLWEDGTAQKDFRLTKDAQKILWRIDDAAEEETIIVEGEIDLLTYRTVGVTNVVSVPNGASVSEYLEACAPKLARVRKFTLSVDGDEAGVALREELARRLGKEICRYVVYPEGTKDANEVLLKHGPEAVRRLLDEARYFPVEGLVEIEDLADEIDYYYEHGLPTGVSTGFPSLDRLFRLAPGSFYIFTGRPGHGKSSLIAQILLNVARAEDWTIGIFSAEDSPTSAWLVKSLQRLTGKPFDPSSLHRMSREEKDEGMRFLQGHFVPIVPTDATFSIDEILRLAKIAVFRRGIKVLLIDPWNEVEFSVPRGMDRNDYISQVLSKIRIFGRQHDVLPILVAHPRKSTAARKKDDASETIPDLDDIAGSMHFRAKADIGVVVHRDIMNTDGRQIFKVINMKTRQPWIGKVGSVDLEFDPITWAITDPEGDVGPVPTMSSTDVDDILGDDW
jgi:twinkle protein